MGFHRILEGHSLPFLLSLFDSHLGSSTEDPCLFHGGKILFVLVVFHHGEVLFGQQTRTILDNRNKDTLCLNSAFLGKQKAGFQET